MLLGRRSTARAISTQIAHNHRRGRTGEGYYSGLPPSRASTRSPTAATTSPAARRRLIHSPNGYSDFNHRLKVSPHVRSDATRVSVACIRGDATRISGAREKSTAALAEEHDLEISREAVVDSGADGGGGLTSFRLTDIGEGIMEVEVLQWFVRPGDRVTQFDKLCEVQSDKANVEITSRYDGVVRKLHWNVGDMVQTGDVLVEIEQRTASAEAWSPTPKQAFLSSAETAGVPELSVPSQPRPVAPTTLSVSTGMGKQQESEKAFGGGGGLGDAGGVGGSGIARRQVLATPAVRRLCREMSIDLSLEPIPGTGPGGRLLKGDVLAYAAAMNASAVVNRGSANGRVGAALQAVDQRRQPHELQQEQPVGLPGGTTYGAQAQISSMPSRRDGEGRASISEPMLGPMIGGSSEFPGREGRVGSAAAGVEVAMVDEQRSLLETETKRASSVNEDAEPVAVPITGIQRAMMEAMQRAVEVPHMTFCDEVNADRLGKLRSDLKEAAERRGVKLSYLPLIVKATSMALTAFPALNASLSGDKKFLLRHSGHNIGVAMDTPRGLLVPCISAVEEMSVLDIAQELNTLQRLGAAGKLGEAELTGTTFTLSNIGSIGGTYASPVILHPQVCIGALGRMQRVPRFDPVEIDKVVAARVFPVSWSADHRVVDGGTLARFSNMWKAYLENPALMLADTR